ncbi:MAG: HprK-related kinase B [Candidatus Azotimanducaceae bacterium]|jgi:HprK-related kinase B
MNVEACLAAATQACDKPLYLNFDGFVVQFNTNSSALISELQVYYQHFMVADTARVDQIVEGLQTPDEILPSFDWQIKQPDAGKSKVKEHLLFAAEGKVVRKVLTGVHLFFIGDRRVCVGPLEDNPNQVVNFINNMHLDHLLAPHGQLFHASAVCANGVGLGMAGQSGKGKSTLALRLLQQGLDLVSNDRLVVQASTTSGLDMFGIAKYPRVNPGTVINQPELVDIVTPENLVRYQAMSSDMLWDLEEKYDAFVEPAFGCKFKLTASMKMFVILNWDRNDPSPPRLMRAQPESCPELVETVMKSPGVMLPVSAARIGEAKVKPYVDLLKHCELLILSGGVDFDLAASEIKSLLLTGSASEAY